MCLFLEEWENNRKFLMLHGKGSYGDWKDKTLAYYASQGVEIKELVLCQDFGLHKYEKFN